MKRMVSKLKMSLKYTPFPFYVGLMVIAIVGTSIAVLFDEGFTLNGKATFTPSSYIVFDNLALDEIKINSVYHKDRLGMRFITQPITESEQTLE